MAIKDNNKNLGPEAGNMTPQEDPIFISGIRSERGFNYKRSLQRMIKTHVRAFYLCALMGVALIMLCMTIEHYKERQLINTRYELECAQAARTEALYEKERLLGLYQDLNGMAGSVTNNVEAIENMVSASTARDGCSMGVVRPDGELVAGMYLDMRTFKEIFRSFNGHGNVAFYKNLGLLLTAPVLFDGRVRYVIYKVLNEDMLNTMETFNSLGAGAAMVRDSEWNVIIDAAEHGAASLMLTSTFQKTYGDFIPDRAVDGAAVATLKFEDGKIYYVYDAPIGESGLSLSGYVSFDDLESRYVSFFRLQYLIYGLVMVILLFMFLVFRALGGSLLNETRELSHKRILQIAGEVRRRAFEYMAKELSPQMQNVSKLGENIGSQSTENGVKDLSDKVRNHAKKVMRALDNILKLSRIERGALRLNEEEYDLAPMLKKLIVDAHGKAVAKKLQFRAEISPRLPAKLYGDRGRIAEVIEDLLDNAVKFTRHGSVSMVVSGEFVDGGDTLKLRVRVTDTGIGMSESMRTRIFRELPRKQLEENRRLEGFGLALSYSYLKLMDGFIDVQSVEGHGSTLTVVVDQEVRSHQTIGSLLMKKPAAKPKAQDAAAAPAAKPAANPAAPVAAKQAAAQKSAASQAPAAKPAPAKPEKPAFNQLFEEPTPEQVKQDQENAQRQWYTDPVPYSGPKKDEVLDVDAALGNFHEDMGEFLEECQTFIRISDERLDKLKRAYRTGDWKYYVLLMGSLRKTAEDLGGGKLFRAAAAMENAARTLTPGWRGDTELKKAATPYVTAHHDECIKLYEEFLKSLHSSLNI